MRLRREKKSSPLEQREDHLRVGRAAAPVLREVSPTATVVSVRLHFIAPTLPAHAEQSFELYPSATAYFEYPCPHGDCDGIIDVSLDARRTLEGKRRQIAGTLECSGHRGLARKPCGLRVSYTISAQHSRERS